MHIDVYQQFYRLGEKCPFLTFLGSKKRAEKSRKTDPFLVAFVTKWHFQKCPENGAENRTFKNHAAKKALFWRFLGPRTDFPGISAGMRFLAFFG
jgi:hypothetical protein